MILYKVEGGGGWGFSLKGCRKCKVPNITKIIEQEAEQEIKNEILFPVETFFYLSAVFDIGFLKWAESVALRFPLFKSYFWNISAFWHQSFLK